MTKDILCTYGGRDDNSKAMRIAALLEWREYRRAADSCVSCVLERDQEA